MGILDSKTRIFDSLITIEGRRQMSSGKMRAEFYSFTDSSAYYSSDSSLSGSINLSTMLTLESSNLPQDSVTFEADDSGKLSVPGFRIIGNSLITVLDGKLFSGSLSFSSTQVSRGTDFTSLANGLLSSSIDNYKNLQILGSPDFFEKEEETFSISQNNVNFFITDESPITSPANGGMQQANLDNIESLYADKRMSHVPNFMFLPPNNKKRQGSNEIVPLGAFAQIGQRPYFEYNDLKEEIKEYEYNGFTQDIFFNNSSKNNSLMCQFFEVNGNEIIKLDVIDFGVFNIKNNEFVSQNDKIRAEEQNKQLLTKHVFFVGKIFTDSYGSDTFVNMFTLIFS